MGIFGQSSAGIDAEVEKATCDTNTNENWSLILDICDKTTTTQNAKDCLKAIVKRMGNADPHIVMQAITLLDACVSNCGKTFHLEIASREFQNEFLRLLKKAQPKVSKRMCEVLKSWAQGEFKNDAELNLIPSLYQQLIQENYDFSTTNDNTLKARNLASTVEDSNAKSQKEEEDLAKAIALSLKEVKSSGVTNQSTSLYPTVGNSASASASPSNNKIEPRKVRALYDFEAAEENELTFAAGDIIRVIDDSDPNWWKGFTQHDEGLFPSNFVTADLSVEPEKLDINQQHKTKESTQFEEDSRELQHKTEVVASQVATQNVEIDEQKIDRLLYLLNEANPEDPSQDTEEMLRLEQEVYQMGPLIDAVLESVDRKHAQISQLSSDLVDAVNLYHSLMRDDRTLYHAPTSISSMGGMPNYNSIPQPMPYNANNGYQGNQVPYFQGGFHSMPYVANPSDYPSLPNMSIPNGHALPSQQPLQQRLPPLQNSQFPQQQMHPNQFQYQMFLPPNDPTTNIGQSGH